MKFHEVLRELIEDNDLTQKQLAKDLGIPASTVGGYVQGTSEPDFTTLLQIADYFSVTTDFLLDRRTDGVSSHAECRIHNLMEQMDTYEKELLLEQGRTMIKVGKKYTKVYID